MKIPEETICSNKKCKKVFCCKACRERHEKNAHAIIRASQNSHESSSVYVLCAICSNQPLILRHGMYPEVLDHIRKVHLPLYCRNCAKVFSKIEELREFSKCVNLGSVAEKAGCQFNVDKKYLTVYKNSALKKLKDLNSISTQTSPCFSSFKNSSLSGAHNCARRNIPTDTKGKLVRSTSTPVQNEASHSKPKDQTFDASGNQVSSIYCSGNENSPLEKTANLVAVPQRPERVYLRFNGRQKTTAVTLQSPLRQIMSRSIQKAFAGHNVGLSLSKDQKMQELNEKLTASSNSPLDLRLSPALRRSQSYSSSRGNMDVKIYSPDLRIYQNAAEVFSSVSNSTSSSSVYKTCHSFELCELNSQLNSLKASEESDQLYPLKNVRPQKSPRIPPTVNTPITRFSSANINQKLIIFETPKVKNDSNGEKFYTPKCSSFECTSSHKLSKRTPMRRPSIRDCAESDSFSYNHEYDDSCDEVFLTPTTNSSSTKVQTTDQATQHGNGFIWSFVSSVIQKGTQLLDNKRLSFNTDGKAENSIIKRCSSIAGSLVRSNSLLGERQLQSLKRKRTNTFDGQTSLTNAVSSMESLSKELNNISSSKRFCIQGRKPIKRMRITSL